LLKVTTAPERVALLGEDVTVPVSVPHAVAEVQDGNLNDAIRVDQLNAPFVFKYSFV
jgi:hypothetical protein